MIARHALYQTVDLGTDVDRIADSLQSVQVTWVTGLSALAMFGLGLILARLARRWIRRLGETTDIATPEAFRLGGRIAWYGIMFFAIGAALGVLGFDIIPMLSAAGLIAVVLAFALGPLLENFAAGVTLQSRRPFEPGDQVSLLGIEGTVKDITARAVLLEALSGEHVYLPNRSVLDNSITNFTALETRRSTIDVGLDYSTDLAQASRVIRDAVVLIPGVAAQPEVAVYLHEFGESTINASVWFWHASTFRDAWRVRHEVAIGVKRALDAEGITIAFPQRVLWWGPGSEGGDPIAQKASPDT